MSATRYRDALRPGGDGKIETGRARDTLGPNRDRTATRQRLERVAQRRPAKSRDRSQRLGVSPAAFSGIATPRLKLALTPSSQPPPKSVWSTSSTAHSTAIPAGIEQECFSMAGPLRKDRAVPGDVLFESRAAWKRAASSRYGPSLEHRPSWLAARNASNPHAEVLHARRALPRRTQCCIGDVLRDRVDPLQRLRARSIGTGLVPQLAPHI